jgi:tetratricopeptide (TPR) repeat protein
MWTWLSRLFRSNRSAERAEAEGRVEDAARLYLESGDRADAVRVYLRAGETARSSEERRTFLVRAHGLSRTEEQRDAARRALALVTLSDAEAVAPGTDDDRRRLFEAAEDLERLGAYRDAARAWLLLEERDAAVRTLTLAGDLDALESITGARDAAERDGLRRRAALEGALALWNSGDRAKSLRELRQWVAAHGDDHEARATLDMRAASMLRDGRCETDLDGTRVTLLGRFPVALGREADVSLRGASVSRKHALICHDRPSACFTVEDAGSRAGTTIDGVAIAAPIALAVGMSVGLGGDLLLRVEAAPDPDALVLVIDRGMDRGRRIALCVAQWTLPFGVLHFDADGPVVTPQSAVSLNGQKVAVPFILARGDRIEAERHVFREVS